jgi:hypothetical protein
MYENVSFWHDKCTPSNPKFGLSPTRCYSDYNPGLAFPVRNLEHRVDIVGRNHYVCVCGTWQWFCTWLRTSSLNNELENSVGSNPTNRQMAPVDLILLSSMIGSLRLQICKLKSGCSPKTQGFGRVWAPQLSNSCSSASWLGDSKYAEFFREFSWPSASLLSLWRAQVGFRIFPRNNWIIVSFFSRSGISAPKLASCVRVCGYCMFLTG